MPTPEGCPTIYEQLDTIEKRCEQIRDSNAFNLIELIQLIKLLVTKIENLEQISKSTFDATHSEKDSTDD